MSESEVSSVYQLLILFIGIGLGVILMALLWRWIFKVERHIKNQQAIIYLLILQCKKQGASDEEIKKIKEYYGII